MRTALRVRGACVVLHRSASLVCFAPALQHPQKYRALIEAGIDVVEQVLCEVAPNVHSFAHLRAKKEKMGHALSLGGRKGMETTYAPAAAPG